MSTRSLPSRPSLAELEHQVAELQQAHGAGSRSAAARIAAHHPGMKGNSLQAVLDRPLTVADARTVLAREYGFDDWTRLSHHATLGERLEQWRPHPRFDEALAAMDAGDADRLQGLFDRHPELVHARARLDPPYGYFTGAMLLHHVARNPGRRGPVPGNAVAIARQLLDAGAEVNAVTLGPNGGTTMGLLITSKQASDANISGPLIDLLLERGAHLGLERAEAVLPDWRAQHLLDLPLANHAPRAAEKLIALGAPVDVCAAAALGRMDLLRDCFGATGCLRSRPQRRGAALSERDAIGLALLFAYVNRRHDAADFLLEKDGNWNMTGVNNGTALHRAAWDGDLPMVRRLVAKGADISNRDNPFTSTPLSWAQHNRQDEVFQWMRTHCAIDLHEAVAFDLREHVEARLREDPASVNRFLDQWDIPRCTPLHWAAWTHYEDVDGTHSHDPAIREDLVRLLLDSGADPNIVAGNGLTPLDIARAAEAPGIAALLERRGGKPAEYL